jgi:hypothetical protein
LCKSGRYTPSVTDRYVVSTFGAAVRDRSVCAIPVIRGDIINGEIDLLRPTADA